MNKHDIGVTEKKQAEGAADATDMHRLPESVEHEHGLI
jgi:hypothetical protein